MVLSDETQIGDKTWRELRPKAMSFTSQFHTWTHDLSVDEKELLNGLRNAQLIQGNLEELNVLSQVPRITEELEELKSEKQELTNMLSDCCTQKMYGDKFIAQDWYLCFTCKLVFDEGMCKACAETCHKGCQTIHKNRVQAVCDCATKKCKQRDPDYLKE